MAALLVAGRLSDEVGRRPILVGSLGTLAASTVLYIFATSPMRLFVARGIQGFATGVAISTAGAELLDLQPNHESADGTREQNLKHRRNRPSACWSRRC